MAAHALIPVSMMVIGCEANLICVGHTHHVVDMQINGIRIINPGSISNPPWEGDKRASYAIIHADEKGYRVEQRRVDYDRAKVGELLAKVRHPSAKFLSPHFPPPDN